LGEDLSERKINWWKDGVQTQKKISYALLHVFHEMLQRYQLLHVSAFPIFAEIFITRQERELKANG